MADPAVVEVGSGEDPGWEAFVAAHPDANLYHSLAWRNALQEVFRHRPRYLRAERGGRVTGILPLFCVRLPLLGAKLISIPYDIGSGGALTEDDASERALVEAAVALARGASARYLELRADRPRPVLEDLGFRRSEPALVSVMDLDSEEAVWGRVAKDHRKAVRKAERRGVEIREAEGVEEFDEFYAIYLRAFRDFGTPPYGRRYFRTLHRRLAPSRAVRVLLARVEGRAVGGLVLFQGGANLVSKFAACLPEAVPLRAYPALYAAAVRLGLALGCRRLSWGTSTRDQVGLIEFKDRWGSRTAPACVYSLPLRGSVPDLERYYDSEGLPQRIWKRLPVAVTPLLGAPINRWFC